MGIEVTRAYTANSAGELVRTFRSGDFIGLTVAYHVTDVPPETRVRITFNLKHLQHHFIARGDELDVLYHPDHWIQFEGVVSPGNWWSWAAWPLPTSNPRPSALRNRDWRRLLASNSLSVASWAGPWELTAFVAPVEAPRDGQFDHSRERWLYQIQY